MSNSSTNTILDLDADHGKFFRVDIDSKKFSFECEQKFEIEPEIVDKIVTLTIFTFVKEIKLILSDKDTRTLMYKNKIFVNAVEMYKKRLKIKKFYEKNFLG
jgi:hypothetical protein